MRSRALRCLACMILMPFWALGAFGGARILAHWHDGCGVHVHPLPATDGVELAVVLQAIHHGHDSEAGHHAGDRAELRGASDAADKQPAPTDGVLVEVPDHEQIRSEGIDLAKTLAGLPAVLMAVAWPQTPDMSDYLGSPGGGGPGGPRHLTALGGVNRLLRTSTALLL